MVKSCCRMHGRWLDTESGPHRTCWENAPALSHSPGPPRPGLRIAERARAGDVLRPASRQEHSLGGTPCSFAHSASGGQSRDSQGRISLGGGGADSSEQPGWLHACLNRARAEAEGCLRRRKAHVRNGGPTRACAWRQSTGDYPQHTCVGEGLGTMLGEELPWAYQTTLSKPGSTPAADTGGKITNTKTLHAHSPGNPKGWPPDCSQPPFLTLTTDRRPSVATEGNKGSECSGNRQGRKQYGQRRREGPADPRTGELDDDMG
nr:uncharacterized protein LOC110557953 isoform X1 [Meriones unguiculatus]XP_021508299.1 uncharacterized protein LOC110557955 isoform X1 [Meriones unguiculatus]